MRGRGVSAAKRSGRLGCVLGGRRGRASAGASLSAGNEPRVAGHAAGLDRPPARGRTRLRVEDAARRDAAVEKEELIGRPISFRKRSGLVDATGGWLAGAKGENPQTVG